MRELLLQRDVQDKICLTWLVLSIALHLSIAVHRATPVLQYELRVATVAVHRAFVDTSLEIIEARLDCVDPRGVKFLILLLPFLCCRSRNLDVVRGDAGRASFRQLCDKALLESHNLIRFACDVSLVRLALFAHANYLAPPQVGSY